MPIEYTVIRSFRKSVSMKVKDGRLYVYASPFTTDGQIRQLIASHQRWINRQLNNKRINLNYDLDKDENIWILGKPRRLTVITGRRKKITLTDDQLIIEAASRQSAQTNLKEYLSSIVERIAIEIRDSLGMDFEVRCRYYKSRWGCNFHTKNPIVLNYLLACTPEGCIRQVVCHEICHFRVHNHQKAFYAELQRLCPDYRVWLKQLKQYTIS